MDKKEIPSCGDPQVLGISKSKVGSYSDVNEFGLSVVGWREDVVRGHHWERKEMVKAKFCAEVSKEQGVLSNMLEPEDQGRPVGTGWDAMAQAGLWGVVMASP